MAYDDRRGAFAARPALHNVVHVEHDGRRFYGRDQSIGFQYTAQPSMSSPPTQPYAPTGPIIHMACPSRRPLPTPRNRPESMPLPPRQPPLIVQAPAPSRPAILAPSAALAQSPPQRRPLPTPTIAPARLCAKHTSVDLTRPPSPVKSTIGAVNANLDRDLCIPSSFSRRTAPLPDVNQRPAHPAAAPFSTPPPTWPRSSHSDVHETQPSKSVPLRTRNFPATFPATIGANVIERRSTVSGPVFHPTPASRPGPDVPRAGSPERAQPAQRHQLSPSRRPLPYSPTEPPRVPTLHQRLPTSSKDGREPSSPSDNSSVSEDGSFEPMTFADPMQAEEEEEQIVFAKNLSPKYGIRDLPARSRIAIANRDDIQTVNTDVSDTHHEQLTRPHTVRSSPLPPPPPSSSSTPQGHSQPPDTTQNTQAPMSPPVSSPFSDRSPVSSPTVEPRSLTLRLATMGLAEERERERQRQTQQQAPCPPRAQSPTQADPGPASPVRQHQGWPANVPPLPRKPGTTRPFFGTDVPIVQSQSFKPNGISPSLPTSPTHPARPFPSSPNISAAVDRNSFAQQSPRPPPHSQSRLTSRLSDRQLEKQRARDSDIDLDDAPPPSLRRSPSPARQSFASAVAIEITNDTPPRRQWTPGLAKSRIGNASGNGTSDSYAGYGARSQSPERRTQPPTQHPIQSVTQPQQTAVPRISLPDGHHDDIVDDDVSGFSAPVVTPAISISDAPRITVSGDGGPVIAVSSADSSPVAFSPPKISISNSAQSQRPGPPSGNFGSRHTQVQELSPSQSMLTRGPPSKRGLPPPPSHLNSMRPNGLSCGGCNGPIVGRIVSAMGQRWHPNCFKCTVCNELLEHVSSYERDGKPYCHLDYHEAFAPRCFHCKTAIIDERFITLDDPALGIRTYHEQHFFCAECGDPFLAPSGPLPSSVARSGELNFSGDGDFVDDDVGFTVYKGHPYCEACHVRLRMPKCKACKKSIRDGVRAVEALGGKWCWGCFVCGGCKKPFEDPSFFLRDEKPYCEPCFSLILRNEV